LLVLLNNFATAIFFKLLRIITDLLSDLLKMVLKVGYDLLSLFLLSLYNAFMVVLQLFVL
jgi:hypothetical protein